jgi:hypothetical protein
MNNDETLPITKKIHEIRRRKVMLDFDLAELYGIKTKALRQAVKRNPERFPDDFVFQLDTNELTELVTTCDQLPASLKHNPYGIWAFTELGVAMLSSVLRSPEAIKMNISIMRAFILLRKLVLEQDLILQRITQLEDQYDQRFESIEQALDFLIIEKSAKRLQENRKRIGFNPQTTLSLIVSGIWSIIR